MKSKRRKGLPHDLEQEVYDAMEPIVEKYKKTYVGKGLYRLHGIIDSAVRDVVIATLYKDQ